MPEQPQSTVEATLPGSDMAQAVLSTALSLALAAGIGAWLLLHDGATPSAAGRSAQPERAAAAEAAPAPVDRPTPPRDAPATHSADDDAGVWLYIVSSAQQAQTFQEGVDTMNRLRAAEGLPPLRKRFVVLASDAEETLFWLLHTEQGMNAGALGQTTPRVVDLRRPEK